MNLTEHLLVLFQEEAGEIIQASSKILRFGPYDRNGDNPLSNAQELNKEYNDLLAIKKLLCDVGIFVEYDRNLVESKLIRVQEHIEYSRRHGYITS